MAVYGNWIHGNTAAVESPENTALVKNWAGGTEIQINPHKSTWVYGCIPTPVAIAGQRSKLARGYILFNIVNDMGAIREVRIHDGISQVQRWTGLDIRKSHLGLDPQNTFNLTNFHDMATGVGISFLVVAGGPIDEGPAIPTHLHVAAFGADFDT